MMRLNAELVRLRVGNITRAAEEVGVRPASVFDLLGGGALDEVHVKTLVAIARMAHCRLDELIITEPEAQGEDFATSIANWTEAAANVPRRLNPGVAEVTRTPEERTARMRRFPETPRGGRSSLRRSGPWAT